MNYQQYQPSLYFPSVYQNIESLRPRIQSLQMSTTDIAIRVALIAAVSYIAYKFVWTPYSIKRERDSCIESCYTKAEKRAEKE